jgi:hypothetical protein
MRKQCLEFALPHPGEICKHLAGAYNSNSHAHRLLLSYFCVRKQAEKPMQWRKSLKKICHKSSELSILFEGGETLAFFDPTDIVAKKPQPLL